MPSPELPEARIFGRVRLWTLQALWLTLWLVAGGFLLYADIQAAKHRVEAETDELAVVLNDRLVANEQILRGFSALVGVLAERNETELRRYAAEVIANSPQVFGLEIVRRIARGERAALATQIQRSTGRTFTLKSFSYRTRQWAELEDKLYYSPIVFMEPMRPDSEGILGLDIDSVPFLREALSQAQAGAKAVASHPFRLIEGNLAYVVFFPLAANRAADAASLLTVNMVIDAEGLLPDFYRQRLPLDRWDLSIRHADFAASDERGYLVHLSADKAQGLEKALLNLPGSAP